MIHDFDQICDLFVLACLYEPLSEVALDRHMEHFFLLTRQASCFDLLLHFNELFLAQLHHLNKFCWAEEKRRISKLSWESHFHKL